MRKAKGGDDDRRHLTHDDPDRGPGTGKTTVIRGICHLFARLKGWSLDPKAYEGTERPYPIRLVAPTGRAAKRMSEATGLPAMTIHRLLGWKGSF